MITTNHIAKSSGISPGNLYYHYKNKEEIIFSLFEKMILEWESEEIALEGSNLDKILDQQLKKTFKYVWQYRFVHRELVSLLEKDEKLKRLCKQVFQRRLQEIKLLLSRFESMGILLKLNEEEREFIAQTALLYGLFWQPYLDVLGEKPSEKNVLRGVNMIRMLLQPYLIR